MPGPCRGWLAHRHPAPHRLVVGGPPSHGQGHGGRRARVPRAPLVLSGGPVVERRRDLPLTDVLALQRAACERAGSALYARIIDAMVDDVGTGGVCAGVLAPWAGNAMADAIPLRFLAAVPELVLTGEAPAPAEDRKSVV